jgi:glycosyltransferase involved in cell wall biosynthesis
MKNIKFIINSMGSGGAEKVMSLLLEELSSKNYDLELICLEKDNFYPVPKNVGVKYLSKSTKLETGIKKLIKLPILAFRYKKHCKGTEADISISFMNRSNYINILAKILGMKNKIIISERAMPSLQHKSGLQGFVNRFLIKLLYNKASKTIANSIGNSIDLIEKFGVNNVTIINNPINIKQINELSNEKVDIKLDKFSFVTVGRLDSGKNHQILIKAMKDIEAYLYIIGDGPIKKDLESMIKNYKLEHKIFLLGRQENPYKYISKMDCFLFSSLYEGFPNVLVEALACGLPIISSDCQSGPREILVPNSDRSECLIEGMELNEYGILIPINNEQNLKEAMKSMMDQENLKDKYSQNAFARANDFDIKIIIKQYEDAICAV